VVCESIQKKCIDFCMRFQVEGGYGVERSLVTQSTCYHVALVGLVGLVFGVFYRNALRETKRSVHTGK